MWEGHASKQRQTYKQIIQNDIQKGRKTLSNWNPRWRKQHSSEESETVSWATPPSQLLLSRQVWNRRVKTEGKELQGLGETIVKDTEARCSSSEKNIGLHFKPCSSRAPGRTSGHSWQSEKFGDRKTHYRSETADFPFPLWSQELVRKKGLLVAFSLNMIELSDRNKDLRQPTHFEWVLHCGTDGVTRELPHLQIWKQPVTAYNILSDQKAEGGGGAVSCCAVTFEDPHQTVFSRHRSHIPKVLQPPRTMTAAGDQALVSRVRVGACAFHIKTVIEVAILRKSIKSQFQWCKQGRIMLKPRRNGSDSVTK